MQGRAGSWGGRDTTHWALRFLQPDSHEPCLNPQPLARTSCSQGLGGFRKHNDKLSLLQMPRCVGWGGGPGPWDPRVFPDVSAENHSCFNKCYL